MFLGKSLRRSTFERYRSAVKRDAESGLTVLELMIVVVIVGLLAAVSIPIFMNQQKNSIEATLKSDLRNAASTIMTEAVKTQGRMPAWLPNYATKSPDNSVIVDTQRSNQYVFCLIGSNPKIGTTYYYSSVTGQLGTTACPSVQNGGVGAPPGGSGGGGGFIPSNGKSFVEQNQEKRAEMKALYIPSSSVDHGASAQAVVRAQIASHGFDRVDHMSANQLLALTDEQISEYALVVTNSHAWSTPYAVSEKLRPYYEAGGKVLQDGDDTSTGQSPWIGSHSIILETDGRLDYNPTKNTGLSPAFPYSFKASSAYSTGSSRCITSLTNGAVAIAEAPHSNGQGDVCKLVYGANNSNGGRWVVHWRFISLSSGVGADSINWLLG